MFNDLEKPLQQRVDGYSYTSIFRTIGFIGDSLSSGEFEIINDKGEKEYHDLYEYSWGQFIARKNGLKAYNFSRGGMTAKKYIESFAEEKGYWNKDKACQAYVIALGVNDLKSMELGTANDVNKDTFASYYMQIICCYREISPEAKFFLVGMPKSSDSKRNEIAKQMTNLLIDIAGKFQNVYVLNLYEYGCCYDEEFKEKYYLNGHMNPMGYIYTAEIVDSYIDYIIRHNSNDFKYVGLINSGIKYVK